MLKLNNNNNGCEMVDVLIGGEMIRLQSGQHDEQYIRLDLE